MDLRILPAPPPVPQVPIRRPVFILLQDAKPGSRVQLMALRMETPRRELLHRMGLVESRHVRVVFNDHKGRVVLTLDEDLFLLGRRETAHIEVRVI